jgi:hypothetical protein
MVTADSVRHARDCVLLTTRFSPTQAPKGMCNSRWTRGTQLPRNQATLCVLTGLPAKARGSQLFRGCNLLFFLHTKAERKTCVQDPQDTHRWPIFVPSCIEMRLSFLILVQLCLLDCILGFVLPPIMPLRLRTKQQAISLKAPTRKPLRASMQVAVETGTNTTTTQDKNLRTLYAAPTDFEEGVIEVLLLLLLLLLLCLSHAVVHSR